MHGSLTAMTSMLDHASARGDVVDTVDLIAAHPVPMAGQHTLTAALPLVYSVLTRLDRGTPRKVMQSSQGRSAEMNAVDKRYGGGALGGPRSGC